MSRDRFAARRDRLIRRLRKTGAEALLVTNETNVTYLTGFSGDSSYLLIGPGQTLLLSDSRYTTQIEEECPGLDVSIRSNRQPMTEAVAKAAKRAKLRQLGFESSSTTFAQWETLKQDVGTATLVPAAGLVEQLREQKDREEIAAIRKAVAEAERGFAVLRQTLLGEMTELQAAHDLEHTMRRFGAERASFPPIIAVGDRAALPHARPTGKRISESPFVLVDWGAEERTGYKSDLTRVLATGKISSKLEKVYRVVLNAQLRGIEAIRPGVPCRDVDAAARKVIEQAGHGRHFGHGLGHGVGLDIHEGPRFSPASEDVLKPGMVVTVEPGIYLPGWGGVRIEDDILVTRDGCEVLTSVPKEFEQIVAA